MIREVSGLTVEWDVDKNEINKKSMAFHLKRRHWYLQMNIILNYMMMNIALMKTDILQSA